MARCVLRLGDERQKDGWIMLPLYEEEGRGSERGAWSGGSSLRSNGRDRLAGRLINETPVCQGGIQIPVPHTRRPSLSTVALQAGREQEREKDSARRRVAAGRRRMRNVGVGGDTSVHSRRRTRSRSARQTEGIQRGIPPPLPPADAAVVPFCRTAGQQPLF